MWKTIENFARAIESIGRGLAVTIRNALERPITVQYPYERLPLPERFRGQVVMLDDATLGGTACIACGACVRSCPADCIAYDAVEVTWEEPKKRRQTVSHYRIDWGKCINCGFCVAACPVNCLTNLGDYELSSYQRDNLLYVYDNPTAAKHRQPEVPFRSGR